MSWEWQLTAPGREKHELESGSGILTPALRPRAEHWRSPRDEILSCRS